MIVDLFGGSGLLSHVAKRERPDARVIYNDFDYFCDRVANVGTTNEILAKIRVLLKYAVRDKKVPEELQSKVLDVIRDYGAKGYVDYQTLGSSLLFSGKWANSYEDLAKHTMFNCVKQLDYCIDGYLDGLEIVHKDYKELFAEYKDNKRVLFVIDPPYLSTEVGAYKCYWKLRDYLDVLNCLRGVNYIYFTSEKSQVVELCKWIRENPELKDPFENAEVRVQNNKISYCAGFADIMLIKRA